jgi:uncharacterized membrane protein YphA (DoxX/SURF4 family)
MNVTLWIVAGALAALFLASGLTKLAKPKEKVVAATPAVENFSQGAINAIGVLEILAAIGLILPAVVDIAPIFVPLAAVGLALLMAGAMIVHARRREAQGVAVTLVLLALAALVAWGRFGPESFTV